MAQLPEKVVFDKYRELLIKKLADLARLAPACVGDREAFAARFVEASILAAAKNPAILQCSPESKAQAALAGISLGLLPGVTGQGYYVPYGRDLAWITGYQGMVELAHRSGVVAKVESWLVYRGEEFRVVAGTSPAVIHVPDYDLDRRVSLPRALAEGESAAEGEWELTVGKTNPVRLAVADLMIGAYAVVTYKAGSTQFHYMTRADLEKVRLMSRARSGPWFDWPEEMYKKCPVRRLAKMIPQAPDLARSIEIDDAAEQGVPQILALPEHDHGAEQEQLQAPEPKPKAPAEASGEEHASVRLCPVCAGKLTTEGCLPGCWRCTACGLTIGDGVQK